MCDHQQSLNSGLETLRKLISAPTPSTSQLANLVNSLQQDANGITSFLAKTAGIAVKAVAPTEASTAKAQKVFHTPELLEMILLELQPQHVLVAQQVTKTFDSLISTSPKLQHHLGLRPNPESSFAAPRCINGWGHFTCSPKDCASSIFSWSRSQQQSERGPNDLEICASFSTKLPRLGDRCRSMLICQPPVYEMEVKTTCCNRYSFGVFSLAPQNALATELDAPKPLRSKTGITIGDLLDATEEVCKKHRTCPHAQTYDHDDKGFVVVSPAFKGTVRLKDDDPTLRAQRSREEKARDRNAKAIDKQNRMDAYVRAKQQGKTLSRLQTVDVANRGVARSTGAKIPTMEKFEAGNVDDEGRQ